MRHLIAALALAACSSAPPPAPPEPTTITLTGMITPADHQTYREIPFTVPPGTTRITVDFTYEKDNRTVIDIGLRDSQGQRGWSGGNKSHFEIGVWDATPSYKPGTILPGEWKLVLGVPSIREGQTSAYTATVTLDSAPVTPPLGAPPSWSTTTVLSNKPGWYRGDFHTHTAHSDGSCDVNGARAPCPAHETFEAAQNAGLDFVVVTDHNTITQLADIAAFQAGNATTLVIPGTEITTFSGHANVVGNTDFLDFQLGSQRLPALAKLFDQVEALGAFISVNHPTLPSGEACMGCGWTVKDTDWSRVTAIEVINGASLRTSGPEGAFNGIAFWEARLREGHRITAIAGSDNHDATDTTGEKQSPVGKPATVVHADGLSTEAIVAGVKSGRAFVDVAGMPEARFDIVAATNAPDVAMGGDVRVPADGKTTLNIRTENLPDGVRVEPVAFGLDLEPTTSRDPDVHPYVVSLQAGQEFGWFRANVRDAAGKLLLLSNPIYIRRAG